jgi:lysophospholipase L1-like esterase
MAGTNDIAGNTGKMTLKQSFDNFRMMTMLANANHIHVLLASVPPADHFPWRPGLETVKPIREINAWLKTYAREAGATWIDYTPVLGDAAGAMKPGLASDGVHPTAAGYDAMATVIEPYLKAHKA